MAARGQSLVVTLVLLGGIGCGRPDRSVAESSADDGALGAVDVRSVARPIAASPAATAATTTAEDTSMPAGGDAVVPGQPSPARSLMQRVVDRYRRATAYRDDGVVRLAYLQSGVPQADEAPLRVRYEASGRLRLSAYALDLACQDGHLQARIRGPAAGDLQHQLLQRPLHRSPLQLDDLYADPVITHFGSAGLGGPSPQLELLLSPQPLAGLLSEHTPLKMGSLATIDGAPCQAVEIDDQPLRYVIWIDRQTLLVRRIELPLQGIPPAAKGATVEDPRLTIELAGAAFAHDPAETYRLVAEKADVPVRRFVPRPPPLASELIGRQPAEFELRSTDAATIVSHHGAGGKSAVLLWVADHEGSQLAADQLQTLAANLPAAVAGATDFLIVMAEPTAQEQTERMLRRWQLQLPWADDTRAIGRDVFHFSATPAMCVLAPDGHVQWVAHPAGPQLAATLPAVLGDLAAGVDVGKAIRGQYEQAQRAYQEQLQEARWSNE